MNKQWSECIDIDDYKDLTDQEAFCLWYLQEVFEEEDLKDFHSSILHAARTVYQAPIFEDALDVDVALQGLRQKDIIAYSLESPSQMIH